MTRLPHTRRHTSRHLRRPGQLALPLVGLAWLILAAPPALAQREVPKLGFICPLGYVDLLNGTCSTLGLMNYTVRPTYGEPCQEGWINVGGRYCRKL